jgi:peptidoglycan/LPS O-acetylase OafA/YrhL
VTDLIAAEAAPATDVPPQVPPEVSPEAPPDVPADRGEPVVRIGRRPELDGVRGLAILFVLLAHGGLLGNGNIGVDVFFALSGFLITNLLYGEWNKHGTISFRRFYTRRARRLGPALLIVLAALGIAELFGVVFQYSWDGRAWPFWKYALSSLLFVNNWIVGITRSGGSDLGPMSPTWSLASEEQFYFVWPLVLWLLLRRRTSPYRIGALLIAAIAALTLVVPLVLHLDSSYNSYFSPLDRFAELLVGCLAAVIWQQGGRVRFAGYRYVGWLAFGFLLYDLASGAGLSQRATFLTACAASAVLILSLCQVSDGVLGEIFRFSPLRYLGRVSYALYLYQLPIDMIIKRYLSHYAWPVAEGANVILLCVFTIPLAGLSWRLVESRILNHPARERPAPSRLVTAE